MAIDQYQVVMRISLGCCVGEGAEASRHRLTLPMWSIKVQESLLWSQIKEEEIDQNICEAEAPFIICR